MSDPSMTPQRDHWLVLRADLPPGSRWRSFRTRRVARLFRFLFGGEIYRGVRTH